MAGPGQATWRRSASQAHLFKEVDTDPKRSKLAAFIPLGILSILFKAYLSFLAIVKGESIDFH